MKRIHSLWRISVIALAAATLLAGITACTPARTDPMDTTPNGTTAETASPVDSDGDVGSDAPEEIGEPYELIYSSLGDGTCTVSDIVTNPRYTEPFDLTIPATSPDGERVVAVENPGGFGYPNIPRVLLPEDFEIMIYRIRTHFGKDSFTAERFESYFGHRSLENCSTEEEKKSLLALFPWAAVTDFYYLDGTITEDVELPKLALWMSEAAPDYTAREAEQRIHDLVTEKGMSLSWKGSPLDVEHPADSGLYIQSITLADGIETIGAEAFCHSYATTLTLPATLTELGDRAFAYCRNVTAVTWPQKTLRRIGNQAFTSCHGLSELTLTGDGLVIGAEAFLLTPLTALTLGEGVAEVGANAFQGCSMLETVKIGDDVTVLGAYAFSLEGSIRLSFGENSRLSRLEEGSLFCRLVETTLPRTLTYVGENALYDDFSFAGTMAEWEAIEKHEGWSARSRGIIHCTDGDVRYGT